MAQLIIDQFEVIEVGEAECEIPFGNTGGISNALALQFGDPGLDCGIHVAAIA